MSPPRWPARPTAAAAASASTAAAMRSGQPSGRASVPAGAHVRPREQPGGVRGPGRAPSCPLSHGLPPSARRPDRPPCCAAASRRSAAPPPPRCCRARATRARTAVQTPRRWPPMPAPRAPRRRSERPGKWTTSGCRYGIVMGAAQAGSGRGPNFGPSRGAARRRLPFRPPPVRFKLFSDPVHGFVSVPRGRVLGLVESPEVQRLRRIRQLGVGDLVFPGAEHSRFGHALGAMALMHDALATLAEKGTPIKPPEHEAALAAALLHDIGHGPFSHTLEHLLLGRPPARGHEPRAHRVDRPALRRGARRDARHLRRHPPAPVLPRPRGRAARRRPPRLPPPRLVLHGRRRGRGGRAAAHQDARRGAGGGRGRQPARRGGRRGPMRSRAS